MLFYIHLAFSSIYITLRSKHDPSTIANLDKNLDQLQPSNISSIFLFWVGQRIIWNSMGLNNMRNRLLGVEIGATTLDEPE